MRPQIYTSLPRDGRLLFWGSMAWEFGIGLYNLLITLFMEQLGASPSQIGLLVGTQGIARIAVTLPSGIIAERFDRRKVIFITTGLTVPAVLLIGLAQTWWQMFPGMILMMAGNIGTPAFSSYIVDMTDPRTRGRAFTMIYSVGPAIATIIAPTLGGFIAGVSAIRTVFFISAVAYAVSTFAFSRISTRQLHAHAGAKASYREALSLPVVRAVGGLKFGVLGALMLGVALLPNYLEDRHHIGIETIGRFGSMNAIGSIVMSLVFARVAFISNGRGIAIGTLAVGALCGVVLLTGNPWALAPAFMLRGGFLVIWSLFYAVFGDITPERLRSRVFALGDLLGALGFGLAPFLAGPMYGWRPAAPLVVCLVFAPLLAAGALVVERRFVAPAIRARGDEAAVPIALIPAAAAA